MLHDLTVPSRAAFVAMIVGLEHSLLFSSL
jgi:hypothetical protein